MTDRDPPETRPAPEAAAQPMASGAAQGAAEPAPVHMSRPRMALYMTAATTLSLARGLGLALVSTNIPQLQGGLSATTVETTWLIAAYMAPQASLTLALLKLRTQYGLRRFGEVSIAVFVLACLLSLLFNDLESAMMVRFFSGVAAAPISTLGFFYMLEAFPQDKKLSVGLSLALTNIAVATPLARLISPTLLEHGAWSALAAFELGLALLGFAFVYTLPLTPMPRAKAIHWRDVLSYVLIAIGLGAVTVVLTMGRLYWWFDAPWIGWALALSVVTLSVAVMLELHRSAPLIHIHWLFSPSTLRFAGMLLVFRMVLAEQTSGAPGMFQVAGLMNEQMRVLYIVILIGTMTGGFICAATLKPGREPVLHIFALLLLIAGAMMDAQATSQTRPDDMLLSQGMIALASGLFLPPAMAPGLLEALKGGPLYLMSFITVFLATQNTGAMLGSAIFTTLIQRRTTYHSHIIAEGMAASDPQVMARIGQYGAAYAKVLPDPAAQSAQGMASLSQVVTREATVLAYNDAFALIAAIAAAALAALLVHLAINALLARRAAAVPAAASA